MFINHTHVTVYHSILFLLRHIQRTITWKKCIGASAPGALEQCVGAPHEQWCWRRRHNGGKRIVDLQWKKWFIGIQNYVQPKYSSALSLLWTKVMFTRLIQKLLMTHHSPLADKSFFLKSWVVCVVVKLEFVRVEGGHRAEHSPVILTPDALFRLN